MSMGKPEEDGCKMFCLCTEMPVGKFWVLDPLSCYQINLKTTFFLHERQLTYGLRGGRKYSLLPSPPPFYPGVEMSCMDGYVAKVH